MGTYLLKSTACLLVFYLFYVLLLERQNNHGFKRYYLLGSMLAGLGIPLMTLMEYVVVSPAGASGWPVAGPVGTPSHEGSAGTSILWSIMPWAYGLGLSLFGWVFTRNLARIYRKYTGNPQIQNRSHTKVLLDAVEPPHTFFRYLFLHGLAYRRGEIPPEVLAHEEAHIRQRHSLDLMLTELVLLVFWFNPVIWCYRRAIRLNHEFLADREVLQKGFPARAYQQTLLRFTHPPNQPAFVHAINYSSIKKRIKVMKNSTAASRKWLTCSLVLPMSALLLLSFSDRKVVVRQPQTATPATLAQTATTRSMPQDGASRNEMRTYNELARKYNKMIEEGSIRINSGEVETLKEIYGRMNARQREDAEPFPDFPPPPPAPRAPARDAAVVPPHPPHAARSPHPAHQAHDTKHGEASHPAHPARAATPPPAPGAGPGATLPPPPPPPDPKAHLKSLAADGAVFYYKGKQVPSGTALERFDAGEVNRIDVRREEGDILKVYLDD